MSNNSKNQAKAEDTSAKGTESGADNTFADFSKQLADLGKQVQQFSTQNQALSKRVSDLEKENATLKKGITVADKPAEKPSIPTTPYVAEDGKKYKWQVAEFFYKKQKISAVDAMADETIMNNLIEIGSGVLKQLA